MLLGWAGRGGFVFSHDCAGQIDLNFIVFFIWRWLALFCVNWIGKNFFQRIPIEQIVLVDSDWIGLVELGQAGPSQSAG